MADIDLVQFAIQSGNVGISVYLIYIGRQIAKDFNQTLQNHLSHDSEVKEKLNKTLNKLIRMIESKLLP